MGHKKYYCKALAVLRMNLIELFSFDNFLKVVKAVTPTISPLLLHWLVLMQVLFCLLGVVLVGEW